MKFINLKPAIKHGSYRKPFISYNKNLGKLILFVWIAIIVVALSYTALKEVIKFFETNTILTYQVLKVETHAPFEVISRKDLAKRNEEAEIIANIYKKAMEDYKNPQPTETCNQTTGEKKILFSEFFDIIWQSESTRGTNNKDKTALHLYCRSKGMWNEIGYNPQGKHCFKDREEAELYVAYYLKKYTEGMTLKQALCRWNTGKATDTCAYAEGKLSLAN